MWIENDVFREDMEAIAGAEYIPWQELQGSTVFVTGATGLIGFNVISGLMYANQKHNLSLKVLALVRDRAKAEERFAELIANGAPLKFIEGDLMAMPEIQVDVDYIIHGGSPTASKYFVEHPVETIAINLNSSHDLLELARAKQMKSIVFLSSMEVYGSLHRQEKVDEKHESFIDTMNPRNSYPEAKRMVEAMFTSYAAEYGVPAKVIRLTQTFGAGVRKGDNRVFAQFARSVMKHEPIVLLTKGGTKHDYLYTADAVTAILTVLLNGQPGEAYNAANESSYCSIKEMAETAASLPIADKFGGKVEVKIAESGESSKIYPPELYMDLDTRKIAKLGWKPEYGLDDMFTRMIKSRV